MEQLQVECGIDQRRLTLLDDLAKKAHLEARQRVDLRRDLAARLQPSRGPYNLGDGIWYWDRDLTKIRGGEWIKGKVIGYDKPAYDRGYHSC